MLTRKQHELLLFINKRLGESGICPSFDEMKEALGLKSKSGVHRLITASAPRMALTSKQGSLSMRAAVAAIAISQFSFRVQRFTNSPGSSKTTAGGVVIDQSCQSS